LLHLIREARFGNVTQMTQISGTGIPSVTDAIESAIPDQGLELCRKTSHCGLGGTVIQMRIEGNTWQTSTRNRSS
jgi:hypothetical protein